MLKIIIASILLNLFLLTIVLGEPMTYKIVHDYAEGLEPNPNYFSNFRIYNTKISRKTKAFSADFTLIKDLPDMTMAMRSYMFLSNEYRLFAPIRFSFNLCKSFENGFMGFRDLLTAGNLTTCPLLKGVYYVRNFLPEENTFPNHVPFGKYRMDYEILHKKAHVVTIVWYGSITELDRN